MSLRDRIGKFLVGLPARRQYEYPLVLMTSAEKAARPNIPEGVNYVVRGTQPTGTGITTSTHGVGPIKTVSIQFDNYAIDAIAAAAAEAVGVLVHTLPAGAVIIRGAYMDIALTNTDGTIDADTPDVGIGTTIATGAVSDLSGTPAFENILTGQTATDVTGTATVKTVSKDTALVVEAAGDHTIHLNIADTWAGADIMVYATGTIIIEYTHMD